MPEVKVTRVGNHSMVTVRTGSGFASQEEELTELEAEQLIKDVRRAIDQCRSDNRRLRRLGEH